MEKRSKFREKKVDGIKENNHLKKEVTFLEKRDIKGHKLKHRFKYNINAKLKFK